MEVLRVLPPSLSSMERDWGYLGTYLFLAGCLAFNFQSICLLHVDPSFLNAVYFLGATLFTLGSLCYAVDAENRRDRNTARQVAQAAVQGAVSPARGGGGGVAAQTATRKAS